VKVAGALSEIRDGGGAPSLPSRLAPLAHQAGHALRSSKSPAPWFALSPRRRASGHRGHDVPGGRPPVRSFVTRAGALPREWV